VIVNRVAVDLRFPQTSGLVVDEGSFRSRQEVMLQGENWGGMNHREASVVESPERV